MKGDGNVYPLLFNLLCGGDGGDKFFVYDSAFLVKHFICIFVYCSDLEKNFKPIIRFIVFL